MNLSKTPALQMLPDERNARKPYKNNASGCKVEQTTYKANALEHKLTKHDVSSKHFLLVFIGPDAVLLMHLIIVRLVQNRSRIERYCTFYKKVFTNNAILFYRKAFAHRTVLCAKCFGRKSVRFH